ncbi:hypothetical protein TA3x_004434 [Tundrisphaera sp. TA3]|uniref:hypothetical protein n=1 Tax=Tundrisphaera sp. TA3 TaxID=3435775 RepID=UPI003EC05D03
MTDSKRAFERAMRLAAVSGLRASFGPALLAAAYNHENRRNWALAAVGEMVVDKVPGVPSRASLPAMLPRAAAGYYVAKTVMEREGVNDPWVAPLGAAVAAGVGALAPRIRGLLGLVLRVPSPMIGLAEDYLALKVGSEAVGLTMDDLKRIGEESIEDVQGLVEKAGEAIQPQLQQLQDRVQSAGAGSM